MDEITAVIDAYTKLITVELTAGKRGRFERIAKYCEHATRLERMGVKSVADQMKGADGSEDLEFTDGNMDAVIGYAQNMMNPNPRRGPIVGAQPSDSIDLVRELITIVQPMMEAQKQTAASNARQARIDELLSEMKAAQAINAPTETITDELRALLAKGVNDAVVRAEFLRGSTTHAPLAIGDGGDGRQGDDQGSAGPADAPGEGAEEGLAVRVCSNDAVRAG